MRNEALFRLIIVLFCIFDDVLEPERILLQLGRFLFHALIDMLVKVGTVTAAACDEFCIAGGEIKLRGVFVGENGTLSGGPWT